MADRFGWIGTTRAQAVRARVATIAHGWLAEWRINAPEPLVTVDEPTTDLTWRLTAGGSLALGSEPSLAALGAWLLGKPEAIDGTLPGLAGEAALTDFVARLTTARDAMSVATFPLASRLTDGSLGALSLVLAMDSVRMALRLDRSVVDRLAPIATSPRAELASLHDAVDGARARVVAELDLGSIALSELHGMKPGDVLMTDASLDTLPRLRLSHGGSTAFASARLGERHGRRALCLVGR